MANDRPDSPGIDEATGTEFVGHEWDGIEELDNPLPRWWVLTFYITIVWAVAYCIAYPAWPLLEKGTEGVLRWTSRGQLAAEQDKAGQARAGLVARLDKASIEEIVGDPELMRSSIAGGAAAYKVNCVQCHGAGAAGSEGYPNLNDDEWLWGGDLKAIETTLVHGIRHPGDAATRFTEMPAFGRDELLTGAEIDDVVSYVLTLSGREKPSAAARRGAEIFATQCAICHSDDGKGMREFGAPDLADAIWLYGGSREAVRSQIFAASHGVMPAWGDRLDPVTIKMLSAYVHSLGGGESFAEVAQPGADSPAAELDEQP
jgi:cytochrome c oxidase cbb3-type subunit III